MLRWPTQSTAPHRTLCLWAKAPVLGPDAEAVRRGLGGVNRESQRMDDAMQGHACAERARSDKAEGVFSVAAVGFGICFLFYCVAHCALEEDDTARSTFLL